MGLDVQVVLRDLFGCSMLSPRATRAALMALRSGVTPWLASGYALRNRSSSELYLFKLSVRATCDVWKTQEGMLLTRRGTPWR